jgi:hypothetical protein
VKIRYVNHSYDDDVSVTADEIYWSEPERIDTGLLNARGEPIYRQPIRLKVGFDLRPRNRRLGLQ